MMNSSPSAPSTRPSDESGDTKTPSAPPAGEDAASTTRDVGTDPETPLTPELPPDQWSHPKLSARIRGEAKAPPLTLPREALAPLEVDPDELLDLVMDLGRLLLEHGAETYRVEDSVSRVLTAYRCHEPSAFAVPSLVAISFKDDRGQVHAKTRRASVSDTNLDRIYRLNTLSRYLTAHTPDMDYFRQALEETVRSKEYDPKLEILASGAVAGGFALMLAAPWRDIPAAFLGGCAVRWIVRMLKRLELNAVFYNIIGAAWAAAWSALVAAVGFSSDPGITTIAILMNLVPGALLTNAIRDIIATDYMSGLTKMTEALMIAASLAVGAGVGYSLGALLGGVG